ncbi:MAG: hypothetical protein JRH06_09650 [Deltaproteobacteria bacterium]|nr:hypothetical protein [Deltaproteobacteria bacterium]
MMMLGPLGGMTYYEQEKRRALAKGLLKRERTFLKSAPETSRFVLTGKQNIM